MTAVIDTAIDWDRVADDLAPIRCERTPGALKRKSRDYYWFSPILKAELDDVLADIVVMPADVGQLIEVARYCVANRLPVTPRGAGTGNYGQAMPLSGGVLLDLSLLAAIVSVDGDAIRAQTGAKLIDCEYAANAIGSELRFHPSTWKSATIGGFVAGGSSGCGAINYGTLHTAGNVRALKVLTMEAEPRLLELEGAAAQALVHAYGTTGLIVEIEMALAPQRRWHDRIIAFADLATGVAAIDVLARDDAIAKKELGLLDAATVAMMRPISDLGGADEALIVTMIAEETLPAFDDLIARAGGRIVFERAPDAKPGRVPPMFELCWNHTTLHALGRDPGISYMQVGYPADYVPAILAIAAELGDETPTHLEMARIDGTIACFGLPLLRFTSVARLEEIYDVYRRHGCTIFNPHTYRLETGGMQVGDPVQIAFRRTADPFGLLNPGKMIDWEQ